MKIIFFNTIALGDYLIQSKIIKDLKNKFNCEITSVCSPYNSKIISKHDHIDHIILYDKNWSLKKKINCFLNILKNKYYLSIVFDCQKFSMFANFFLKSKFKRGIITSKFKFFFKKKIYFYYPSKLISFFLFDKYVIHPKRKYLEKYYYLPKTWINLLNDFVTETNYKNIYYFNPNKLEENLKKNLLQKLNIKEYILIHLDYKWTDLKNIKQELFLNLLKIEKKFKTSIIITSFNNNSLYFLKLKKKINSINLNNFKKKIINNHKIFHFENPNIFLQERLISSANLNISCHSGIIVHGAGANNKKIIDILNSDEIMYQRCWAPLKNYYVIKKSSPSKRNTVTSVFNEIIKKFT